MILLIGYCIFSWLFGAGVCVSYLAEEWGYSNAWDWARTILVFILYPACLPILLGECFYGYMNK